MLPQGRPRVTAPCVRPFSAASPRVSRFESATPGYGAEHRVLAALAGGCVALRARGQNAVMTLEPVDEKRPDAKLEEVFLVQTPLVLPPPFPASLAQLLPKHAIVAARLATGGFVAFDFTPEAPEDPVGALQLLLGGSVPGRLARRSMARLPRSAVRLGRAKAEATVRAVEAVEAAFEPRLSLGKNDCNSYAEKVLEALLADKQKGVEERLFSTLDWEGEDTQELRYKEPSVLNAVVLVAGTTVGAGILALPAVTQPVGFVPSMAALSFSWIYMAVTGLFIAEVACRTMAATGKRNISLQSMAISSVGQAGAWLSSGAFVFLHMALLIAYCSKGGELLLSLGLAALPIPGPLLFAGIFGGFVFVAKGSEALERGNNAFAIVVVASFLALVALALPGGDPSRLLSVAEWSKASDTVPTLLLSLVYHNVVPSVCAQLEGDRKKITTAIVVGSFVPFMMRFGLHGRREIVPLARLATFFLFVQFHLLNGTI
ncbi:unnamed protein product [Effrenium voratum]|nr:unnamed protein product [Effrenium voratum]